MILLALAGRTIGDWWRRAILALAQPAPRSTRDVPPEFYRFPLF
jgi:hypothetical protein